MARRCLLFDADGKKDSCWLGDTRLMSPPLVARTVPQSIAFFATTPDWMGSRVLLETNRRDGCRLLGKIFSWSVIGNLSRSTKMKAGARSDLNIKYYKIWSYWSIWSYRQNIFGPVRPENIFQETVLASIIKGYAIRICH